MTHQLWLGTASLDDVIDHLTEAACAVAPMVEVAACRELIELAFRTRVRQTTACGRAAACRPDGPMWDTGTVPAGETCAWIDRDPQSLPAMLGAAISDLARSLPDAERRALEPRLTMAVRAVFAPLLFENRRCGRAAVCRGEPRDPFVPLTRARHGRC